MTDAAAAATAAFVTAAYETVYDGVMGPQFLPQFARRTELTTFDYAVLLPSVGTFLERPATRDGHGSHDKAAALSMHEQFDTETADL